MPTREEKFATFREVYQANFNGDLSYRGCNIETVTAEWNYMLDRVRADEVVQLVRAVAAEHAKRHTRDKPNAAAFMIYAEAMGYLSEGEKPPADCPYCHGAGVMWVAVSWIRETEKRADHFEFDIVPEARRYGMAYVPGCKCKRSGNTKWVQDAIEWRTKSMMDEAREGVVDPFKWWEDAMLKLDRSVIASSKAMKPKPIKRVDESKRADGRGLKAIGSTEEVTRAKEIGAVPVVSDSDSVGKGGDDLKVTLCECCGKPAPHGQRWCDETCKAFAEQELSF